MAIEVEDLRVLIEQAKLEVKDYRIWHAPEETPSSIAELPMRVGPGAWSGVLTEDEVHVHLGDFATPSTAMLLATKNPAEVRDGRILLVGPDIPAIQAAVIPFAIVVVAGGQNLVPEIITEFRRALIFTDQIEGFMQRSTPRAMRFYLGHALCQGQASFEHVGRAILHLFKMQFPGKIDAIEVSFLTGSPGTILALENLAQAIRQEGMARWRAKLAQHTKFRDDCEFEWECTACDYQHICEELRDIIRLREETLKE